MRASNLNHVSVCAKDLEISTRFYEELFGMRRVPTPNFGFPVQWLAAGPLQLHLFERPSVAPVYHHLALTVDGIEDLYDEVVRRGIEDRQTFGHHLYELPGDIIQLYIRDPGGNLIELDAPGAAALPERIRGHMKRLADQRPQTEENLRATLFSAEPPS